MPSKGAHEKTHPAYLRRLCRLSSRRRRAPAAVPLKAGWNRVLIRVPRAHDAQRWLAAFIPVRKAGALWVEDESVRFAARPQN